MKVFKTCLLIARRCIGILISFCAMFIVISVMSSQLQAGEMEAAFQGEAVPYTIINRDGDSPLVQGLADYLSSCSEEVVLEDDTLTLQEALFYGKTDYILIIPEGFSAAWPDQKIQTMSRQGSVQSYFMDQLADSYFTQVRLQQQLQLREQLFPAEQEEAVAKALESLSHNAVVEKQHFGSQQEASEGYQVYFRMVGYALIVLLFYFISSVQMVLGRKEIRMRHSSAPVSPRRITLETAAYGLAASVVVSLILLAIGYGMHRSYFDGSGWQRLCLVYLNEVSFMFVALGLAVLFSQFTANQTVQSVISNFVALSLSFLGGLFVPMELMSAQMAKIGRLMPTFWYVDTFEKINDLGYYTQAAMQPVWQGMLIQLAYAFTLFCLALVVAKYKRLER